MSDDAIFDDKQAAFIAHIAEGGTWRSACDKLKISSATIASWIKSDAEFEKHYARACDVRADAIFEEMLEIADDGRNDWMRVHDEDNLGYRENGEAIRRSALRLDTRKWVLGRMKPKIYGDKLTATLKGDPDEPVRVITKIERIIVDPRN